MVLAYLCAKVKERGRGERGVNITSTPHATTNLNLELKLNVAAVLGVLLKVIKASELLSQVVTLYSL